VRRRKKAIIVTKRDGTVERFSPVKLGNCLARAMRCRAYDAKLSEPLVKAVAMHLRECAGARPPSTNYIHHCVCSVLRQTGLADVADDLVLARRVRTLRRRRVRILVDDRQERDEAWRKAVVVEMLQNEFGLRHSVCRFLAGQIEQQVFSLNYRVIRRPLLVELVRSEMMAWGLVDEPALREGVAVPPPHVAEVRRPESEE